MKKSPGRSAKKLIDIVTYAWRALYYRYIYLSWVDFGKNVTFQGRIQCLGVTGQIAIGSGSFLGNDISLSVANGGKLLIGEQCSINQGSVLSALQSLSIGHRVRIGEYVSIRDNDHSTEGTGPIHGNGFVVNPVMIEDDVWIGRNATIMPGVRIGQGAVIGAGAFVRYDVPSFAVAVGAPARIVRVRQ